MKKPNRIYGITTTKKPEDWAFIKSTVQYSTDIDISEHLPIFILLSDFEITHDPDFKPWGMISSWRHYKKIPVILLNNSCDLDSVDVKTRTLIQSSCFHVD